MVTSVWVIRFRWYNSKFVSASELLKSSLTKLAHERPIFAARLEAAPGKPGFAQMLQSPNYKIPFEIDTIEGSYSQYKAQGFPPGFFINPRFSIPGAIDENSGELPVAKVLALFTSGGLFLVLFLHHSIFDADGMRIFIECFAAQTRGVTIDRPSNQTFRGPSFPQTDLASFEKLVAEVPEYTVLHDLSGPTQPRFSANGTPASQIKTTGKIFAFKNSRIAVLQKRMAKKLNFEFFPTTYTALFSLAAKHTISARLASPSFLPELEFDKDSALIWHAVTWKGRAFPEVNETYFGNSVLPVPTHFPLSLLNSHPAHLVPWIMNSISSLSTQSILKRLEMVSAAPNPGLVGVNFDPRNPKFISVNTWRHFGADAQWDIPGIETVDGKPEEVRRAYADWGLCSCLILPGKKEEGEQELFVCLDKGAMERLLADEVWMGWVDRVIG